MTGPGRRPPLDLPSLDPLPTAAERAADLIRDSIFEGKFQPGTPLPETALSQALQVSRNTVREAFRTLAGEHLLSYEVNKGMSVRTLVAADVRDIYRLRRLFELTAIDELAGGEPLDATGLRAAVDGAPGPARPAGWGRGGTHHPRFHQMLVAVHDSARVTEFFRRLMTEMRLGFLAVEDPATFHGAYLPRNREVLDHLVAGDFGRARAAMTDYLADAQADVERAVTG